MSDPNILGSSDLLNPRVLFMCKLLIMMWKNGEAVCIMPYFLIILLGVIKVSLINYGYDICYREI